MANKMTNKEMFTVLASIVSAAGIPEGVETSATPDEILTWIDGRIEMLDKKSTTLSKKEKEKIEQNNATMDAIVAVLTDNKDGLAVTNIIKASPALADFSSQKITALLKKLVEAGTVTKEKVKGQTLYKINDGTTDANTETNVQD